MHGCATGPPTPRWTVSTGSGGGSRRLQTSPPPPYPCSFSSKQTNSCRTPSDIDGPSCLTLTRSDAMGHYATSPLPRPPGPSLALSLVRSLVPRSVPLSAPRSLGRTLALAGASEPWADRRAAASAGEGVWGRGGAAAALARRRHATPRLASASARAPVERPWAGPAAPSPFPTRYGNCGRMSSVHITSHPFEIRPNFKSSTSPLSRPTDRRQLG